MEISFADVFFADSYFANRPFAENWESCANKAGFLAYASGLIADFCTFTDANDDLVDYTAGEIAPPDWLKRATCEQALYLINLAKDPVQADKKTTLGIASTDGTVFDKSFAADIICLASRRIITANGGVVSGSAAANSKAAESGTISR